MPAPPTLTAIARHLGISQPTATERKRRGMPTDSFESAERWSRENVRPRVRSVAPKKAAKGRRPAVDPYQAARTSQATIDAQMSALALLERKKILVHRDKVRAELARRLAGLRETLLQMPARMQSVLAAEQDETKVHDLLQDEIHQVLARLVETT